MKLFIFPVLWICFPAFADMPTDPPLRFVSVDEAPANYYDENNEFTGYVVGIVKQLQKQLNIDSEIEVMPEARAMVTLNNNPNIVIFSISRTKQREQNYHWLGHVISKRWLLYSRADYADDVTSLQQIMDNKVIGTIRGDIREKWLKDQNTNLVVSIPDYESAIKMLMYGRIDFLLFESFGVYSALKNLGYKNNAVKGQFVVTESDVYIAMSKSPGSEKLALMLQKELEILMASDWFKVHTNKWVKKLNAEKVSHAWFAKGVLQY